MLSTSTPGGGGIGVRRGVSPRRCLSGFVEARKQVGIRIAWFGQCLDDGPRGTAERHAARSSLGGGQGDGVVPDVAPRVLPDAETGIGAQSGNGGFRRRGWPRRACLCSPRRTTRRRACARSISPCRAMMTRRDFPSMRVCTMHAFAPDRWTRNPKPGSAGRISSRSGAAGFVPPPLPLQVDEKRGVERYSVRHGFSGAASASVPHPGPRVPFRSSPASARTRQACRLPFAARVACPRRRSAGLVRKPNHQRLPRPRGRRSRGA